MVDRAGARPGLVDAAAIVRVRLTHRHDARETALSASRQAIRASANAIRAAHRGEMGVAAETVAEASALLSSARDACDGVPMIRWAGFVADAEKEYAEAQLTMAAIAGLPLPTADDLEVDETSWLNGLAETVGELRRHLLDLLRQGRVGECEDVLALMDDIYALLVTIDFPDGITGGLRRATDVARSILERTRGDLTSALLQERLRAALDAAAETSTGH